MSKMPPEDLQAALQLRQAFAQRTDFHGADLSTPPQAPSGPFPGAARVQFANGLVTVK
jgi:hypothetical protein